MSTNSFGITYPPIDDLLTEIPRMEGAKDGEVGSRFALAAYGADRARQIISYFSNMNAGVYSETFENVGPLVDYYPQEKPLSVAMREIHEGRLNLSLNPDAASEEINSEDNASKGE
jgi:DNA-directed RNA polymerase subunit omega